jgi:hypothetical protein
MPGFEGVSVGVKAPQPPRGGKVCTFQMLRKNTVMLQSEIGADIFDSL